MFTAAGLIAAGGLAAGLIAVSSSTAASTPAWLTKVEATVAQGYKGVSMGVPTSGPKAAGGKNVWNLACTLTIPDCANASAGVQSAGKALGWNVTTVDNNTNPVTTGQQIMSAIAAHADGIVVTGIDCPAIQSALTSAKAASIPTIVIGGQDCSPSLYTATTRIGGLPFEAGQAGPYTQMRIDWAIAQKQGNLKLIVVNISDFSTVAGQTVAALKDLQVCPTCKVVDTINLSIQDLPALAQQLPAALTQYSQANAIFLYSSSSLLTGAMTAIENAGRATGKNKLLVIGAGGTYGEPGLIRSGWDLGFTAFSLNWNGWQAMDFLNRLFHGVSASKLPTVGVGLQLVDATHNLPKGATWTPPINYEADYLKIWGVK
jgi:ABC-type sugar transport system substrate-binding protein